MKSKITLSIFILLSVFFCNALTLENPDGGGEFVFNADKTPCLTDTQREEINIELKNNIDKLKLQKRLTYNDHEKREATHYLFGWSKRKVVSNTMTFGGF